MNRGYVSTRCGSESYAAPIATYTDEHLPALSQHPWTCMVNQLVRIRNRTLPLRHLALMTGVRQIHGRSELFSSHLSSARYHSAHHHRPWTRRRCMHAKSGYRASSVDGPGLQWKAMVRLRGEPRRAGAGDRRRAESGGEVGSSSTCQRSLGQAIWIPQCST